MIGAILTGGASSRFEGASDKTLVSLPGPAGRDGLTLGAVVRDAMRGAGLDPVVSVGGTAGAELGLVTIPDRRPGEGPLAATASVLLWAGRGRVVVVPGDLPRLRASTLEPLVDACRSAPDDTAVIAIVDGRPEHSIAGWPAGWGRAMWKRVEAGDRALKAALELGTWIGVELDGADVADADTPDDLNRLMGTD